MAWDTNQSRASDMPFIKLSTRLTREVCHQKSESPATLTVTKRLSMNVIFIGDGCGSWLFGREGGGSVIAAWHFMRREYTAKSKHLPQDIQR
jgi:hypothetical protein